MFLEEHAPSVADLTRKYYFNFNFILFLPCVQLVNRVLYV